jgi:hypothetical protein
LKSVSLPLLPLEFGALNGKFLLGNIGMSLQVVSIGNIDVIRCWCSRGFYKVDHVDRGGRFWLERS